MPDFAPLQRVKAGLPGDCGLGVGRPAACRPAAASFARDRPRAEIAVEDAALVLRWTTVLAPRSEAEFSVELTLDDAATRRAPPPPRRGARRSRRPTDPASAPLAGSRGGRPRRAAPRPPRTSRRRVLRRRRAVVLHALRPRLDLGRTARARPRPGDRGVHAARARPPAGHEEGSGHRGGAGQDPARAAQRRARHCRTRACICRRSTTARSTPPRSGCACSPTPATPGCPRPRCASCCRTCGRRSAG